jgi:hypothetical protein
VLGGRIRGSHQLEGGGDRVRLSRDLERDAVADGYIHRAASGADGLPGAVAAWVTRRWNATAAGLGLRIGERQEYRDFSF